jgi:hypothetical protein
VIAQAAVRNRRAGACTATHLVLDEFEDGRIFRETDEAEADRETVIQDIVSGQYKKPVRVISFNTSSLQKNWKIERWLPGILRDF